MQTHTRKPIFFAFLAGLAFGASLIVFYMCFPIQSGVQNMRNLVKQQLQSYQSSFGFSNNPLATKKGRLLCWVMTSPSNHDSKARAVKETWGKRCDILLFMSTTADPSLPSVALPVLEGRESLWGKTREAFRYAWDHYKNEADWFFKADDDTYAIIENLRYLLSAYNASDPIWFGHRFKLMVPQGYFSGGAGYVLSREATRRFAEIGYFNSLKCPHDHKGPEDAGMGICMNSLNVTAMDSRDSKERGRFFPFLPEHHLNPGNVTKDYWYWNMIYYPVQKGLDCCSDTAITFHYVEPERMLLFEYLVYQLKPYGRRYVIPPKPEAPPDANHTAKPWSISGNPNDDWRFIFRLNISTEKVAEFP